jgi:hypothetical protein
MQYGLNANGAKIPYCIRATMNLLVSQQFSSFVTTQKLQRYALSVREVLLRLDLLVLARALLECVSLCTNLHNRIYHILET